MSYYHYQEAWDEAEQKRACYESGDTGSSIHSVLFELWSTWDIHFPEVLSSLNSQSYHSESQVVFIGPVYQWLKTPVFLKIAT